MGFLAILKAESKIYIGTFSISEAESTPISTSEPPSLDMVFSTCPLLNEMWCIPTRTFKGGSMETLKPPKSATGMYKFKVITN